jgi:hypothetical protein
MAYSEESNSGLYFIVGGLVVVAFLFGFMMWNPGTTGTSPADISPAAGYSEPATPTETRTDRTRVEYQNNATGDSSVSETTKSTTQQGQ